MKVHGSIEISRCTKIVFKKSVIKLIGSNRFCPIKEDRRREGGGQKLFLENVLCWLTFLFFKKKQPYFRLFSKKTRQNIFFGLYEFGWEGGQRYFQDGNMGEGGKNS